MRFYNPGSPIQQMLPYTNTTKDPRDGSTISNHLLLAPEKDFFDIPDVITLQTTEGEATIPVGFSRIVKAQFRDRGVIMIKPSAKDIFEDDNLAVNEADARAKGDRLWKEYLRAKVGEWFSIVQEIKASGGVPRAATGLFAFALKQLHLEDPADIVDSLVRAKEGKQTDSETKAQIAALTAQVNQLIGMNAATQASARPEQAKTGQK